MKKIILGSAVMGLTAIGACIGMSLIYDGICDRKH